MSIKVELLKNELCDLIFEKIGEISIDANKIIDTKATMMLEEIQSVLIGKGTDFNSENLDFEIVEEIVCIFEKYGVDAGVCQDF